MRDDLIDWVIRQSGLDPDNEPDDRWVEKRLRRALRPIQKWWDRLKTSLSIVSMCAVCIGGMVWVVDCASAFDLQAAQTRNQNHVNKCKSWGRLLKLDATWERGIYSCIGKHKNGSTYVIDHHSGGTTKLKGRD